MGHLVTQKRLKLLPRYSSRRWKKS
ncbi:hypothetical protein ACNKHM_18985 [Shigella sonnei]